MNKQFFVYIVANKSNTVLYPGLTSSFETGNIDPKAKIRSIKPFAGSYNYDRIVYYEVFNNASTAIDRERQIEALPRGEKDELITALNPNWADLSEKMLGESE